MAHVRIRDRDAPFGSHAFADARLAPARRIGLEILRANLGQCFDMLLQRRSLHLFGEFLPHPHFQRFDLAHEVVECVRLRIRVTPLDIETLLHTRLQQRGDPCRHGDLLNGPAKQIGGATDDVAGSVPEQIDGVLDARRTLGSFFQSNAFVRRANSTVRSSNRRSMSARIRRSRNSRNVSCAKAASSLPSRSRTICHRRSTTVDSTASASDAPSYAWSKTAIARSAGGVGSLPAPVPRYIDSSSA